MSVSCRLISEMCCVPSNFGNDCRIKQRSLVMTVLDLTNALGEVHHRLIPEILKYHHMPDHMQQLIDSFYSNFQTSMLIRNTFQTPFIHVSRCFIHIDCLSPLTFSLCFTKFIQFICDQNLTQLGFKVCSLYPIHWVKFVDNAAIITGLENENQILLKHFTR